MKTARFWKTQSPNTIYDQDEENWIKQIQLDAMKEGARRTANVISNLRKDLCGACAEAILQTSEQWTTKDL